MWINLVCEGGRSAELIDGLWVGLRVSGVEMYLDHA